MLARSVEIELAGREDSKDSMYISTIIHLLEQQLLRSRGDLAKFKEDTFRICVREILAINFLIVFPNALKCS